MLISLKALLKFITAESSIPLMDLSQPIEIEYLPNNPKLCSPWPKPLLFKAASSDCVCQEEDYFPVFIEAFNFGNSGYGVL